MSALFMTGIIGVADHVFPLNASSANHLLDSLTGEMGEHVQLRKLPKIPLVGTVAADGSASNFHVVQPLGLGLDDAAIQAARCWTYESKRIDALPANQTTTVRADFLLSAKESRWHLLRVVFATPEGVSRPHFLSAPYPGGDGVSPPARDSASLLKVMGRQAVVTLAFEVDEAGHPMLIRVQEASEPIWGSEAASFVRNWHFSPAGKNGTGVRVPCTIDLVWGEKQFTPRSLQVAQRRLARWSMESPSGDCPAVVALVFHHVDGKRVSVRNSDDSAMCQLPSWRRSDRNLKIALYPAR